MIMMTMMVVAATTTAMFNAANIIIGTMTKTITTIFIVIIFITCRRSRF
jgi:hypothetical protein